jgi:hypothetical protein
LADRNTFVLNTAFEVLVNEPVRSVAVPPTDTPVTEMDSSLFRNDPRERSRCTEERYIVS